MLPYNLRQNIPPSINSIISFYPCGCFGFGTPYLSPPLAMDVHSNIFLNYQSSSTELPPAHNAKAISNEAS